MTCIKLTSSFRFGGLSACFLWSLTVCIIVKNLHALDATNEYKFPPI